MNPKKPKARTFVIEVIGHPRTNFGDSLASKCTGSISEKDSIITPENGFVNIANIGSGNPMDYIDKLLKKGQ